MHHGDLPLEIGGIDERAIEPGEVERFVRSGGLDARFEDAVAPSDLVALVERGEVFLDPGPAPVAALVQRFDGGLTGVLAHARAPKARDV